MRHRGAEGEFLVAHCARWNHRGYALEGSFHCSDRSGVVRVTYQESLGAYRATYGLLN